MAEWDPMGDAPQDAPAEGVEPAFYSEPWPIANAKFKLAQRDHMRQATDLARRCVKEGLPWQSTPDPVPDLSWHKATCTFEKWKHTAVKVKVSTGIVYVTLSRPDENNILTEPVIAALCDAIFILRDRPDIRVAVFTGEGKMFSAGRDPNGDPFGFSVKATAEAMKAAKAEVDEFGVFPDGKCDLGRFFQTQFWHAFATLPQLTVCLANGSALGDGMGILVCCDVAIALKTAFFGFEETEFGIVNAIIAPYVMSKMGAGPTKKMLLLGKVYSAEMAREQHIVNQVVDNMADAHKAIAELCVEITKCGPESVGFSKQLVMGVSGNQISEFILFYTLKMSAQAKGSREAKLAAQANSAKKPKPWEQTPIVPVN